MNFRELEEALLITTYRETFTDPKEKAAWQKGYETAFERRSTETDFERHLKESVPETINLIGLDSQTFQIVRKIYDDASWTERQKYAFMSGLLNGLNEVTGLGRTAPQ